MGLLQEVGLKQIDPTKLQSSSEMLTNWLTGIFIALIVVSIVLMILWILKFKHKVHIMHITGSTLIHKYDKARIWRDKKGILWFRLLKNKYKGKVPAADAKGVTEKGKYHFDLYYMEDKGYVFADQRSEVIKQSLEKDRPEGSLLENLDVWSTEDRTLMIIQQEESEMFKNFSWKEWISKNSGLIIGGVTLVMLIIAFAIAIDTLMPHLTQLSGDRVTETQANQVLGEAINRMVDYMNATQPTIAGVAPQ